MNINVVQIYVRAGINFPFSHHFQVLISEELSNLVKPSKLFRERYSEDFDLTFNLSAKTEITEPEIRGPEVFKKDKEVEYTIFLPHPGRPVTKAADCVQALEMLFCSIVKILRSLDIESLAVTENTKVIINKIMSDSTMFK